jgi:hypothetical protein
MNNYENAMFRSSEEVLHVLGSILGCLQRGRSSLIVPRKRTIDDLMKSRNMVCLFTAEDFSLCTYDTEIHLTTVMVVLCHISCCFPLPENFISKSSWGLGDQLLHTESQTRFCSVPAKQCSWYHEVWLSSGRMLRSMAQRGVGTFHCSSAALSAT